VIDTQALGDYCASTVKVDMESIAPLLGGPCEYRCMGVLLNSKTHVSMFSCLWTGDDSRFLQLHKAALWMLEKKLPKSRQYVRYVLLRMPTPGGQFRFLAFEPDHTPLEWIEVTVDDDMNEANAMIVVENMIESILTTQTALSGR